MTISLIQCPIEWLAPELNRAAAESKIAECIGSDLILLPEMFTTGFSTNPENSTESEKEGVTRRWMVEMARLSGAAIGGSVAIEQDGLYYNRFYLAKPSGEVTHYDKRHLFSYGGEDRVFKAGDKRVIVEVAGVRVLLLICYDLRFGVWCRNRYDATATAKAEWDVMVCVANWPSVRRNAWETLLKARAIENLAYVCGVNRVGTDPSCSYSGGTLAFDFKGEEIAKAMDNSAATVHTEIDLEALREFREKFPALRDSDEFELRF